MCMQQYITITSQGQMSIPARFRRKFQLDKTRKAIIRAEEDRLVIEPIRDIDEFRGIFNVKKRVSRATERKAFEEALARSAV